MIRGYVGLLGQGKTYSMVVDALGYVRKERCQVFTNMTQLHFPEAAYIPGAEGLPLCRNGLIMLDEASTEMSSRFFHDQGRFTLAALRQSRKQGLDLWYTAQDFEDVDKSLRDVTNEVILCKRVAGSILKLTLKPKTKDVVGRSMISLDPEWFPLFDSFEVIGKDGRGGEIGAAAERRRVGRAALATLRPRVPAWRRVNMYRRLFGTTTYRLTPDALAVRDWLESRGRLRRGFGWASDVRDELLRRKWLGVFGLTWENVLDTCTFEEPWLPGSSPLQVQTVLAAREICDALDVARKAQGRVREAKGKLGSLPTSEDLPDSRPPKPTVSATAERSPQGWKSGQPTKRSGSGQWAGSVEPEATRSK